MSPIAVFGIRYGKDLDAAKAKANRGMKVARWELEYQSHLDPEMIAKLTEEGGTNLAASEPNSEGGESNAESEMADPNADTQRSTESADSQPATKPAVNIEIIEAKFGLRNKWVDVTAKVKEVLASENKILHNYMRGLGVKHPNPSASKSTIIKYKLNGLDKSVTIPGRKGKKVKLLEVLSKQ